MSSDTFNGKRLSIAYGDSMYTIAELAKMTELPAWTIYQRYRRGDRGAMLTRPCERRGGWNRRSDNGTREP